MSRFVSTARNRRRLLFNSLLLIGLSVGLHGTCDQPSALRDYQIDTTIALTDQDGAPFQMTDLRGKTVLLYFGFTHCPDFCPATLSKLEKTGQILGGRARHLRVVFVSVDPERDTPAALKSYLSFFQVNAIGLTGTPAQVAEVARRFGAHYERHSLKSGDGSDYTVDHSTGLYLIDSEGRVRHVFKHGDSSQQIAHMLQMILPFI